MELGRSLQKVGDRKRAILELEASLTMDVEDINAHLEVCICLGVSVTANVQST